jgi:FMN phosphatase YigB (HAD superfamily)
MSKISFVYFDVGGVLVRDFSGSNKWQIMKQDMGVKPEDEVAFDELYDQIEVEVCKGKPVDAYLPVFREKFNLTIADNFSWVKYFADHIEANPNIWPAVAVAKSKFHIGLLTDQYPDLFNLIKDKLPPSDWEVIVDSSIEGVKKPMIEIFELAEKRSGVKKEEILFIENNKKNYQATLDFGWQGYLYDHNNHDKSSQDLLKFFSENL